MEDRSRLVLGSFVLGALLAIGTAIPASTLTKAPLGFKRTYAIKLCDRTRYKPRKFTIAQPCWADAGIYARDSHWRYWDLKRLGVRWAKARTKIFLDDCRPDCAGGHFHHRAARVWLTGRGWCPSVHRYVYRLQLIRYVGPDIGKGPDVHHWPHGWQWLGCPKQL